MIEDSKDFVIDRGSWHIDAEAPEYKGRALSHFQGKYTVLLEFLRKNGLLANPDFGSSVSDWSKFEIRVSDLTSEGFALFKLCHDKWTVSYGQEGTQRHLVQWERRLAELRNVV